MKILSGRKWAFSLVEVTLALGVAAFCLLAIFGLLPVSLNSTQASIEQTAAASIVRTVIADLRSTPKTVPPINAVSPQFKLRIPATSTATRTLFFDGTGSPTGPEGTDAVASQNPRYRATLTLTPPANASLKTATAVRILVTWPALADKSANVDPTKYVGSLEILTALDRN